MIMYKCDKCGKIFDWYEAFYKDKKFNNMRQRDLEKWTKEHPDAKWHESPNCNFRWNCIHLQLFEPINENMATNEGVLSAEVEEGEGNNELLTFCKDCMTDFINGLCRNLDV